MRPNMISKLALAVPCVTFSGALMAQSKDVCVPDMEVVVPMSIAAGESPTPTFVTAASADCTTYYIRLTQGCVSANNRCNCRFQPRNDKGRGKGKECVPEPVWKCNKNASKCKSKAEKRRSKCVRDKRRGKG